MIFLEREYIKVLSSNLMYAWQIDCAMKDDKKIYKLFNFRNPAHLYGMPINPLTVLFAFVPIIKALLRSDDFLLYPSIMFTLFSLDPFWYHKIFAWDTRALPTRRPFKLSPFFYLFGIDLFGIAAEITEQYKIANTKVRDVK